MTRKKICFFVGNLNLSGGTERVTTLLANALVEQSQTQVHILNIYAGDCPFFPLSAQIQNHALFKQQVSMKSHALTSILKLRQYIKQHQIDTLIVVDSISCVFTVPAVLGLSVQHICWEQFSFDVDLKQRFRRCGRWLASRYCDAIVTLTQHDLARWQSHWPNSKAIKYCIANPSPFIVQPTMASQNNKTVLSVGRLRHEKGFDLLLQAWHIVQLQYPDWQLQIVGSGAQQSTLQGLIQQYCMSTSVKLMAATADLKPYYQGASIYALSSRSEGFGLVLLEAMAFGLPIVAFNCPVGPHEILHSTKNILVDAENVPALADALMHMMAMDAEQYQATTMSSQQRAADYEIAPILKQWQQMLNEIGTR